MSFVDVMVIICGLLLGSFFNVVAIRALQGESIVYPPSHCPHCRKRLRILDLLPLCGYLFLRARCRYCRAPISLLYPLGEAVTALSFYLVYVQFGFNTELLVGWMLCSLLILAILTDIRKKLILDVFTLPFLLFFILLRLWIGEHSVWFYVAGGMLGFLLLFILAQVSRGGMGGGDIKLYASIGVALGPWLTLLSLMLASFLGAVIGGFLLLTGQIQRKQPIPFAPFIGVGTLVAYLYGSDLWFWYYNLINS